jgi:hypothetical protein
MYNEYPPPYVPAATDHRPTTSCPRDHTSQPTQYVPAIVHGRSETTGNFSTTNKPSLDFTQRLERKLAEYNASENAFKKWLFEILGIYTHLNNKPMAQTGALLTYTNVLGKVASAALIVPTSEALGQLKWDWFSKSRTMLDFEIFDKASRFVNSTDLSMSIY